MEAPFNVVVHATYRDEWPDGFGARGWKLDVALDDPAVIASTSETGDRINTSVLVHDILDHYVSGFPLSGHRNEAMALIQLHKRTGSDPRPDYEQMVNEDLMHGMVSGEPMRSFLPSHIVQLLPSEAMTGKEIVGFLASELGLGPLRVAFVERLFELGYRGVPLAHAGWNSCGLDYARNTPIGLCLQGLLVEADRILLNETISFARGQFQVSNRACQLVLEQPFKASFNKPV